MNHKKILIIGGGGFIGHNLALQIVKRGGNVEIIDSLEVNNYTSVLSNKDNLPFPDLSLKILDQRLFLFKGE